MEQKFTKKAKWYDDELKTLQGEVIFVSGQKGYYYSHNNNPTNFWIKKANVTPRVYFKQDSYFNNAFSEILFSYYAKGLGLNAVETRPSIRVYKNGRVLDGVIVEDFIEDKNIQKEMSARVLMEKYCTRGLLSDSHSVDLHVEALNNLKKILTKNPKISKVTIDIKQIETTLKKVALLDFLTMNTDRHFFNISYIITKNNNGEIEIKLSKIFDNAAAFLFKGIKRWFSFKGVFNFAKKERYFKFAITEKFPKEEKNYQNTKNQLALELNSNKELLEFYQKIKNFDFDQLNEQIEIDSPGFKIPKKRFEFAKFILTKNFESLDRELQKIKPQKLTNQKQTTKIISEREFV